MKVQGCGYEEVKYPKKYFFGSKKYWGGQLLVTGWLLAVEREGRT